MALNPDDFAPDVPDGPDGVGAFTVREVTGDKRELRLVARALPYRPLTLEGTQENEATRYSGNPIRSLQVFGPTEKDTTIKGAWKDVFIGDSSEPMAFMNDQPLLTAVDLTDFVDDIREKGQLVEVTWLHEQRRGIVGRFKKEWQNIHDVDWEIDFVWTGKTKNILSGASRVLTGAIQSVAGLVSDVAAQNADLADKSAALDHSTIRAIGNAAGSVASAVAAAENGVGWIQQKVNSIRDWSDSVLGASDNAAQGVTDSLTAALGMAGQFQGIALDAADVVTAAYSRAEAGALGYRDFDPTKVAVDRAADAPDSAPPDDVGQAVAAAQANRDVVRSARRVRYKAARARAAMLRTAEPALLAAFQARGDTDLRDVALRFYGTADGWRRIMTFNGMGSSRVDAGQVVFVPRSTVEGAR